MFTFLLTAAAFGVATSTRNNSTNYDDDYEDNEPEYDYHYTD